MDVRSNEFAVAEAKARFSELLTRAQVGESIVIKRHGQAIARLVPVTSDDGAARRVRHEEFLDWRRDNVAVGVGRIDYKALIDGGRR